MVEGKEAEKVESEENWRKKVIGFVPSRWEEKSLIVTILKDASV